MKIGIVGDLHIAPPPDKRMDDYFQVGLNKIEEIAQNVDCVIFLGDIFTNARVEPKYVNMLTHHLWYCKGKYGTRFYTIIGNHDVVHEDETNLSDSSLGTLQASTVMDIITPDKPLILSDNVIYRFNTIPVKYKTAQEYLHNRVYKNYTDDGFPCVDILLVHHEYETGTNCFTYNDFKNLGCKMIFLGHDHKPFDEGRIMYPEFTVYRSGSIMRNRADDYNFNRTLYYYVLENGNISCKAITTTPFDKVFKIEAINKIDTQEKHYTEALEKIIEKYENNISVQDMFSIRNILVELNARDEIIDYIKKKYENEGEVFV